MLKANRPPSVPTAALPRTFKKVQPARRAPLVPHLGPLCTSDCLQPTSSHCLRGGPRAAAATVVVATSIGLARSCLHACVHACDVMLPAPTNPDTMAGPPWIWMTPKGPGWVLHSACSSNPMMSCTGCLADAWPANPCHVDRRLTGMLASQHDPSQDLDPALAEWLAASWNGIQANAWQSTIYAYVADFLL